MTPNELNKLLGNIDLYLLDQVLKDRINPNMRILDAGCGEGRNIHYFASNGYEKIYGIDIEKSAIEMTHTLAKNIPKEHFIVSSIEEAQFPQSAFDCIICNAVLHFAKGHQHFEYMFSKLVKWLAPRGLLFIRMTSDVHIQIAKHKTEGVYFIPYGNKRYLLRYSETEKLLSNYNLENIEPLKSVVVHNRWTMTTLVARKTPVGSLQKSQIVNRKS